VLGFFPIVELSIILLPLFHGASLLGSRESERQHTTDWLTDFVRHGVTVNCVNG
jgi:hypothetical protein